MKLLDIEDSVEGSNRRRHKKIKEDCNLDVSKKGISSHEKEKDGKEHDRSTSTYFRENHSKIFDHENVGREQNYDDLPEEENGNSLIIERASKDPTLSWFAGACHVWQSTEDEEEDSNECNDIDNKPTEKRGLWNKLSTTNIFGIAGINDYKNFDTPKQSLKSSKERPKYFWQLPNRKNCDCKRRNWRSDSGGSVFGWANIGFSGESNTNKQASSTPVVELRSENKPVGKLLVQ